MIDLDSKITVRWFLRLQQPGNSQNMNQPAPTATDDMSLDAARCGREFCERAQCDMFSGSIPRCSNLRLLRRGLDPVCQRKVCTVELITHAAHECTPAVMLDDCDWTDCAMRLVLSITLVRLAAQCDDRLLGLD